MSGPTTSPSSPAQGRIAGSSEMADRIRAFPWETTSLGAIDQWPPELLTTVNMMLEFQLPVQVLWGPERVLLYNDAWVPLYVDRHPEALGKPGAEFWSAVWHLQVCTGATAASDTSWPHAPGVGTASAGQSQRIQKETHRHSAPAFAGGCLRTISSRRLAGGGLQTCSRRLLVRRWRRARCSP